MSVPEVELKKAKLSQSSNKKKGVINSSKLFKPYQILSQFSTSSNINKSLFDVNLQMDYVTVSIGTQYIIYSLKNFQILFKSKIFKSKITQLKTDMNGFVYLLFSDHSFKVCFRNKVVGSFKHNERVLKFDILNDYVTFITETLEIKVFKKLKEEYSKETDEITTDEFKISIKEHGFVQLNNDKNALFMGFEHIPTYLNKILVVFQNGYQIINLRTVKFIHEQLLNKTIKCFNTLPILDQLLVSYDDNTIDVINVKKDTVTKKINLKLNGSITNMVNPPDYSNLLIISLNTGSIIIYDLALKKIQQELINQHDSIINLFYLSTKNGFITQGNDNSIKIFIFENNNIITNQSHDEADTTVKARLYKSLQGHKQPPTSAKFKDDEGHFIVSSSLDSHWEFSTRKITQSTKFSNKNNKVKIPGVLTTQSLGSVKSMALKNGSKWDNNMILCYENSEIATIHNMKTHTMTSYLKFDQNLSCVDISECGNFGIFGKTNGEIEVYNLQSMNFKKRFKGLHKMEVVGCCLDSMNQFLYSCSYDGVIGKWDYYGNKLHSKTLLDEDVNILKFEFCYLNDLIAVVTDDDFKVQIIDSNSMKVIRSLEGHFNNVNHLKFFNKGKYILTSSLDSTIRCWDISTGFCIDGFIIDNSELITSFDISENDQFLITTHLNLNGICLWLNKSIFNISNDANSIISLRDLSYEEFIRINLPNGTQDNNKYNETVLKQRKDNDSDFIINRYYETKQQIESSLITLSNNNTGLMNMKKLINIETIRKRSKPTEKIEKPNERQESFFIQLKKDLDAEVKDREGKTSDETVGKNEEKTALNEKLETIPKLKEYNTIFETLLISEKSDKFLDHLLSLSISQLNIDIQLMSNAEHIKKLIDHISVGLKSNKNFEIWNGLISVIFKYHYDIINKNLELFDKSLTQLNLLITKKENSLSELYYFNDCVVKFLLS
ncbi:hypothetical protein QEN19_002500 [Hanseniaspora menglaensis]